MSVGEGATSEGEFWESLSSACTLQAAGRHPGRRQRLRDLGAGRSADAGRRHLEDRRRHFPISWSRASTAPTSSPAHGAMTKAVEYARARKGPGARPREGHSSLLAFAVGRRTVVQDGGGARRRGARAIRSCGSDSSSRRKASRPKVSSNRFVARSTPRCNAAADQAIAAEKPSRDTVQLYVYSPDVDPTSSEFRHGGRARRPARHDGRGHQPHAARTKWRATRGSSSSARTWRTARARARWRRSRARVASSR